MAEQQPQDDAQQQQTLKGPSIEDMAACVDALEAALQPCSKEIEPKAWIEPDYDRPCGHIRDIFLKNPWQSEELSRRSLKMIILFLVLLSLPWRSIYARDFMKAAKKLQRYFIFLQRDDHRPTRAEKLRKEIADMEEELKKKNKLIEKQEKVIKGWKIELKDRLDKHNAELERV